MPQSLLIGGPFHGESSEVGHADRISIETKPAKLGRIAFVGAVIETPAETMTYVRCEAEPRVFVAEGYLPTPEDVELAKARLA